MKLTIDNINLLKDKKIITHVIPSDQLTDLTVDDLKIKELITLTDPSEVIEESIKTDEEKYLIFTVLEDGVIGWKYNKYGSTEDEKTIQYSKDKGETWVDWTSTTEGNNIDVVAGDIIYIKGNNSSYGISPGPPQYNGFTSTCRFAASGTINALLGDQEMSDYAFMSMFEKCTGLTTAPTLPAATLATNCYLNMFNGCTSLTTAPELPATTLASGCYSSMFNGCTSLTTAPELPATTLADGCYSNMFNGCTSLTTAPELPATTLASNCYNSMFNGCTSLTAAPELPVTTLVSSCYGNMFKGCTSLTAAPELPATTLVSSCYQGMFQGCDKLNYIECNAIDNISGNCNNWVSEVSVTGTFKRNSQSNWSRGANGIPSGWTIDPPILN